MSQTVSTAVGESKRSVIRSRLGIAAEWLVLLLLAACAADWFLVPERRPAQPDFHLYFYPAGQHVAQGLSPYLFKVGTGENQTGFVYPPHLALLLAPLGLLSAHTAAAVWEITNLSLLALTVWLSEKVVHLNLGWRRRFIVFFALLLWAPTVTHFTLGSCTLLVAASLTGALLAIQRNRLWLAGLLLAISAVKPQLVFLMGAGLVLRAWRVERSFQLLLTGPLCLVAALLATYVMAPSWPSTLFTHQNDVYDYWGCTTNLRTLLAAPYGPNRFTEMLFWPVCVGACIWLLVRWANPASDFTVLSSLTITWTLLATPYAQGYDYVTLVLPFLAVIARISRAPTAQRFWWIAALALGTWVFGSVDRWFHDSLGREAVWHTLSGWFGEDWINAAWQNSKWDYRFLVMVVPLALTAVLQFWPTGRAVRSASLQPHTQGHEAS